jgi:hypothetical protein
LATSAVEDVPRLQELNPMAGNTMRDTIARDHFLRRLRDMGHSVQIDTVIARDNIYRVDDTIHLMVRTSRFLRIEACTSLA